MSKHKLLMGVAFWIIFTAFTFSGDWLVTSWRLMLVDAAAAAAAALASAASAANVSLAGASQ